MVKIFTGRAKELARQVKVSLIMDFQPADKQQAHMAHYSVNSCENCLLLAMSKTHTKKVGNQISC
jgi:hypothetical protein